MVFHDIVSITDVNDGQRTIIYYIGSGDINSVYNTCESSTGLHKNLEFALEMLEKKNDDLLVIKVAQDSKDFTKFQELYRANITGILTLFAVNSEGIPIVSQSVTKNDDIHAAIENICKICNLNNTTTVEKASSFTEKSFFSSNPMQFNRSLETFVNDKTEPSSTSQIKILAANKSHEPGTSVTETSPLENENIEADPSNQTVSTLLQIRLPNGNRDKQKFDKDALLNEVWVFISTKYKLKDFDLKTYNHQNFSEEEYEMTLKQLDLCPNGVIIVVPKNVVPFNNSGSVFSYGFNQIVTRSAFIFQYVRGLLIMFWNSLFSFNSRPSNSSGGKNQVKTQNERRSSQNSQSKRAPSTKPFGNIHTLRRQDDSDDENNRYNGNSTQQK